MLWLYLRVPRLPSPSFKTLLPLLADAAVAVAAAVPAAVLWPPNRFFGFRDCRLPPSKPPTLRCSFLPLLAVSFGAVALSSGSETAISFFKTLLPLLAPAAVAVAAAVPAALPAVAVAAAVPCYGRTAAVLWPPNLFFGFRDCRLPPSKPPTLRCSFLPLLAVSFGAVALSSGSETSISFFKTLLPLLAPAAVAVAAAVPAALPAVAVAAAVPCYGRTAAVLWPPNLFFAFRDCRLPPSKPPTLRCSFLPLLAVSFGAVALSSGSETAISFFKTLLPLLAPAAVAMAAAVPAALAAVAVAAAVPCYGRTAAVLWPPNLFFGLQLPSTASCVFWCCGSIFGFRDCHLPLSKHWCHCWPMLLWPWPLRSLLRCCGRPIVSSGSETAACPLQNLRPSAAASFHC